MKKGDNSEKKQQFKKVKDAILIYFHIGICVKISDSYVNDEVCRATTDKKSTNIHTE